MGMPITVHVTHDSPDGVQLVFDYFRSVDARYSTYKPNSEISRINQGLPVGKQSAEMMRVLALCEQTKALTNGYFDIKRPDGTIDPSGLVKGWAIHNAAHMLLRRGVTNFCIEAGGDVQVHGRSPENEVWHVGIRNPFDMDSIIKVAGLHDCGMATSGTYVRGQHIYNPRDNYHKVDDVVSLTVIGPNIYDADRYATAAFAMGQEGIAFIESIPALEGYMIDKDKVATYTSGFGGYIVHV